MKFEFFTFKTVTSCSLMMFTTFNLSAQETFKINAETVNKISIENSNIFLVDYKEIEYYPFVEGKIFTESYKNFLDSQKEVKEEYSETMIEKKKYEDKKNKKQKIIQLINEYLSDTKNDKLLDAAEKLANELNLKFVVEDKSYQYRGWGMKPKKTLFIKNSNGKYAGKGMLKEYLESMNIELNRYDYNTSYQEERYSDSQKEEQSFSDEDKYTIGKVKSKTLSKRKVYIKSEKSFNNWSELYGTYKEISKVKSIDSFEGSKENYKEIIIDENNYKETRYRKFDIDRLVENIDTGKIYYFPRQIISKINSQEDYLMVEKQLITNGYKLYETNGEKFINTKHYKVPVTSILKRLIELDKDYLKNIDLRFEKMQALRKQALTYNPKFDNYIRLYRLQRNKMSKADISA